MTCTVGVKHFNDLPIKLVSSSMLGNDCYFGYFIYFERNLQLCYFVCCIVVILFYVLYIIIGILGLCLYCSMHV